MPFFQRGRLELSPYPRHVRACDAHVFISALPPKASFRVLRYPYSFMAAHVLRKHGAAELERADAFLPSARITNVSRMEGEHWKGIFQSLLSETGVETSAGSISEVVTTSFGRSICRVVTGVENDKSADR